MTRINTNTPSPKFHEVEAQTTEAAHVKPTAPPSLANVVDEFVAGSAPREQPSSFSSAGRTFSVADLERMNPEQRAQTVGASVVQSAVYPREDEAPYSLSAETFRKELVDRVGQYNDVSAKTMNGPDICAACAVVNAMILSGDGRQSAGALRSVFENTHAKLPSPMTKNDAERALRALKSGEVTPFDVAVLQQVAAAVLDTMQRAENKKTGDNSKGVSAAVLQKFVGALKGAPLKGARFELSENSQGAHWTTTNKGIHADSAPTPEARKELGHFTV